MNTTTEHLKALLVDDGREFAMVRKADLKALVQIADSNPDQGRWLDSLGDSHRVINMLRGRDTGLCKRLSDLDADARKHGEERRRYMANNKALQSRIAELEQEGIDGALESLNLACDLHNLKLSVRTAIRKAPAACRMLGLVK